MTGRRGFDVSPDPVIAQNPVGSLLEAGFGPDGLATATFDRDQKYRYRLSRVWDQSLPRIVWCMLNPSIAGASLSDRTLTRTISFTMSWGGGAVEIVNLFAWRTPYPVDLKSKGMTRKGRSTSLNIESNGGGVPHKSRTSGRLTRRRPLRERPRPGPASHRGRAHRRPS